MGAVARWLERRTGDRVVLGSNSAGGTSLRNFCNSVYPSEVEVIDPTQGVNV